MVAVDPLLTIFGISVFASMIGGFSYILWIRAPFESLKVSNELNYYPKVSIIVPVRNEEKRLEATLDSLQMLDYPNFEVIIVDGSSEDGTRRVAERYDKFTLINEGDLPTGWIGKVWGCWVGAQKSTGEILLFTDADVKHSKESLKLIVNHLLSNNLEALTVLTHQEANSFWERMMFVVLFLIFIASGGSRESKNKKSNSSIANGQYFLLTRDCYFSIDGHRAVYNNIVEDIALAYKLKENKKNFEVVAEPSIASTRMYPKGLRDMWEGWSKNLYYGSSLVRPLPRLALSTIIFWSLGSPLLILMSLILGRPEMIIVGLLAFLLLVIVLIQFSNRAGDYPWYYSFVYVIGILFFLITLLNSYQRHKTKRGAKWRGRIYYPTLSRRSATKPSVINY